MEGWFKAGVRFWTDEDMYMKCVAENVMQPREMGLDIRELAQGLTQGVVIKDGSSGAM